MLKEDTIHWFPLRVRNSSVSRLNELKKRLDSLKDVRIETYIPFSFMRVADDKMDFAPVLLNYIFVRSTYTELLQVKGNREYFEPLRFVMHPVYDENYRVHDEILTVPDRMMNSYMQLTQEQNDKVIFLNNIDYACRPSQPVQIVEGQFAGVAGRIKRIGGNRCVVMPVINNEMAVGVMDVPRSHLRYLSESEFQELTTAEQ